MEQETKIVDGAIININNFEIIGYLNLAEHSKNAKDRIKITRRMKTKIKKLCGDNDYDFKSIYNELRNKGVVPVEKNTIILYRSSTYIAKVTIFIQRALKYCERKRLFLWNKELI